MIGGLDEFPPGVNEAWDDFAGDQGHTWLGHLEIVFVVTWGGWKGMAAFGWEGALWGIAGLLPGLAILAFYAVRELKKQRDLKDMVLDWVFALQGFVLGGALAGAFVL